MYPEFLARCLEAYSREACLWCDSQGVIQWVDQRAEHMLGARTGMTLTALAAPGSEDALLALCQRGVGEQATQHALRLCANEEVVTVWCTAVPMDEGMALQLTLLSPIMRMHVPGMLAPPCTCHALGSERGGSGAERELEQLRQDLSERNRGIVALHAELDDKATATMTSAEIKSRIVSSVNHDLRTAIHSILGLSKLLLDELDGPLTAEQKMQVGFIRRAAEDLSHLAGDLIDLAKLDSGAMELRVQRSSVTELFGTLRGMLAPMLADPARVSLVFAEPDEPVALATDINKLSQILRNLIANALRFTERGEVRVSARKQGDQVRLSVRDTGIGIAPADHERIFEGLRRVAPREAGKGNGLGLRFARKLARLLGGDIAVASRPGQGATFTVTIPAVHANADQVRMLHARRQWIPPSSAPVLLVEHDHRMRARFAPHLVPAGFPLMSASTVQEARTQLTRGRPAAIALDIMLEGEASWRFLGQLESSPATRDIPVLVLTGSPQEAKALAKRKGELWLNPVARGCLARTLEPWIAPAGTTRVLVASADDWVRYLVRTLLDDSRFEVQEVAADELDLSAVRAARPSVLLLYTSSPHEHAAQHLLAQLDEDAQPRSIPVVLLVPHMHSDEERAQPARQPDAWLSRAALSSELAVRLIEEALCDPPPASTSASMSRSPDDA